jgi:hypothetical protein
MNSPLIEGCVLIVVVYTAWTLWAQRHTFLPSLMMLRMRHGLCWIAGADMRAIRRSTVGVTEISKIGINVVVSGLTDALGCAFTLQLNGQSTGVIVAGSFMWGIIIGAWERSIFRALPPLGGPDCKATQRALGDWALLLFRVVFVYSVSSQNAASIVTTLAHDQVAEAEQQLVINIQNHLEQELNNRLKPLETRRNELRKQNSDFIAALENEINEKQSLLDTEVAGTAIRGKTSGNPGDGVVANQMRQTIQAKTAALDRAKTEPSTELKDIEDEISTSKSEFRNKILQETARIHSGSGWLGQGKRLNELAEADNYLAHLLSAVKMALMCLSLSALAAMACRRASCYDDELRKLLMMHREAVSAVERFFNAALQPQSKPTPSKKPDTDDAAKAQTGDVTAPNPLQKKIVTDVEALAAGEWKQFIGAQMHVLRPNTTSPSRKAPEEARIPSPLAPPSNTETHDTLTLKLELFEGEQTIPRRRFAAEFIQPSSFPLMLAKAMEQFEQHLATETNAAWSPPPGWVSKALILIDGTEAKLSDPVSNLSCLAARIPSHVDDVDLPPAKAA